MGGFYPGSNYLFGNLNNTLQGLSAPGLGYMDFFFEGATALKIPGSISIKNAWDRMTKLDNNYHQKLREFSSVVIPSIQAGGLVQKHALSKLPAATNKTQKIRNETK